MSIDATWHHKNFVKSQFYGMKNPANPQKSKTLTGWIDIQSKSKDITSEEAWKRVRTLVKLRMDELGYKSIESLANEAGMNRGTLARVLQGQRDVQFSTLWRIMQALGWDTLPNVCEMDDEK